MSPHRKHTYKLRNIKLVDDNDADYRAYITNIQLANYHLRPKNTRSYSDIVAYPLELTVREWAKQSGAVLSERIISYEALQRGNYYKKRFKEIDLVYKVGSRLCLVEVKVSSSNKAVPNASKQLRSSYSILKRADFDLKLMIVHINLNYKNVSTDFHSFNDNFLENEFTEIKGEIISYNYIQLEPHDIFNWGFKNGVIKYENLLSLAIDEADTIHDKRIKRQELKDDQVPPSEWPDELKNELSTNNEEQYIVSFGESGSSNELAYKLRAAFKNKDKNRKSSK